jgi:farnesyl-diphosphate farnesyltransferase
VNETRILERTSRSFYLTLRLLPRSVRADASLGYLLARATDTIADTSTHPIAQREEMLRSAAASLGRETIADYDPSAWSAAQRDPAERELLAGLPDLWRRMSSRPAPARDRLVRVMAHIVGGQIMDLERFGPGATPLDDSELDRYTFLVAGSVGEFWTELCEAELPGFATAPAGEMRAHARRYGQALQLVNIIRDRRMDAALGRIYVPDHDVVRRSAQAREWLAESVPYCAALRSGRLRYATLLPALLGWRTLAMETARVPGTITPAKVPRSEVRRWMRRALPIWWSRAAVRDVAAAASASASRAD